MFLNEQNMAIFNMVKTRLFKVFVFFVVEKYSKQPGDKLGQSQYKLGLNFTLIFCRFSFSRFGLVELVRWI